MQTSMQRLSQNMKGKCSVWKLLWDVGWKIKTENC